MKKLLFLTVCIILSATVLADSKKLSAKIDSLISNKVQALGQKPRKKIDDPTFCRRVYLDIIGRIPTYGEIKAFLDNKVADKRKQLIDKLLNSKGYVSNFSNYWGDVLRVTYVPDKLHSPANYMEYVKQSLRENKSYKKMVLELLAAEGELYKPGNGHTGFYAREDQQLDHMSSTVKTFLGMSIECAQCHDHPFDDWTQKEFYELAAFTTHIRLRVDPLKKDMQPYDKMNTQFKPDFNKWIVLRESLRMKHAAIYGNGTGYIRLPGNYQYEDAKPNDVMKAGVLFGPTPTMHYKADIKAVSKLENKKNLDPHINSKKAFADWITSPKNHMFTKNIVNRMWSYSMGSELAGPLTQLELNSTGDHPELTAELENIMIKVDYDLKTFLRVIFNSRVYQSEAYSIKPTDKGKYLFDGPVVRRMSAENIWDSFLSLKMKEPDAGLPDAFKHDGFTYFYELSQKMGPKEFKEYILKHKFHRGSFYNYNHEMAKKLFKGEKRPDYMRASEFDHPIRGPHEIKMLGRSTRQVIDGANDEPNIPQSLMFLNGRLEHTVIRNQESYLNKKVNAVKSHQEKLNVIFLSILNRLPQKNEISKVKNLPLNRENTASLIWALANSNEFKFKW